MFGSIGVFESSDDGRSLLDKIAEAQEAAGNATTEIEGAMATDDTADVRTEGYTATPSNGQDLDPPSTEHSALQGSYIPRSGSQRKDLGPTLDVTAGGIDRVGTPRPVSSRPSSQAPSRSSSQERSGLWDHRSSTSVSSTYTNGRSSKMGKREGADGLYQRQLLEQLNERVIEIEDLKVQLGVKDKTIVSLTGQLDNVQEEISYAQGHNASREEQQREMEESIALGEYGRRTVMLNDLQNEVAELKIGKASLHDDNVTKTKALKVLQRLSQSSVGSQDWHTRSTSTMDRRLASRTSSVSSIDLDGYDTPHRGRPRTRAVDPDDGKLPVPAYTFPVQTSEHPTTKAPTDISSIDDTPSTLPVVSKTRPSKLSLTVASKNEDLNFDRLIKDLRGKTLLMRSRLLLEAGQPERAETLANDAARIVIASEDPRLKEEVVFLRSRIVDASTSKSKQRDYDTSNSLDLADMTESGEDVQYTSGRPDTPRDLPDMPRTLVGSQTFGSSRNMHSRRDGKRRPSALNLDTPMTPIEEVLTAKLSAKKAQSACLTTARPAVSSSEPQYVSTPAPWAEAAMTVPDAELAQSPP